LTCYVHRRRIGAWLDGALDDRLNRATAAHVERCARCSGEAESLTRLKAFLQPAAAVADPDWTAFWPGIVRGIQDARESRPVPRRAPWLRPRWAYGGALAAALLVSLTMWQLVPTKSVRESPVIVRSADSDDPRATVMVYSTPERDLTVVWVVGLEESR
jgi:anti-sigma factor RsiW